MLFYTIQISKLHCPSKINRMGSLLLLCDRQLCLPVQCQPQPWDKLVKVKVSGFCCIGPLVFRAAFNSGKVDTVTILNLSCMVYMFQCDSTHGKLKGTVKAENRKLVINGKSISISIFQERDPTNIKWGDAGAEYVMESTGVFTMLKKVGVHHLFPFCGCPPPQGDVCDGCEPWQVWQLPKDCQQSGQGHLWQLWHHRGTYDHSPWHHCHPEDRGWSLWETVVWWLRGCPEHHPCFHCCCQGCGRGHPWVEWDTHWHDLLCPHP